LRRSPAVYERAEVAQLVSRLGEPRRFIQIMLGPRQTGKTTAVRQALAHLSVPHLYATADTAMLESPAWLEEQWTAARDLQQDAGTSVLAVDEVQKIPGWSSWVKRLWDEDAAENRDVRVVLTGSSPLLMQQGLAESLAGRFEVQRMAHWSWPECRDAFGWDLDRFIFFGGYPGAAPIVEDFERWRSYILDSIVEATVSRDVVLLTRVQKPALMRRVFNLACVYAGQPVTYETLVGQLQDAGNTTTVAHYLDLLDGAGLVAGIGKYSGNVARRRRSTPKLVVHSSALSSAAIGRTFEDVRADPVAWGRTTEIAVGAHLLRWAVLRRGEVSYWRDRSHGRDLEVDYVAVSGEAATGIEVKTAPRGDLEGLRAFSTAFPDARTRLIGPGGTPLEEFFASDSPV
jgi:uncharacterized protein